MRLIKDIRYLVVFLLVVLAAFKIPSGGVPFLTWLLLSVATSSAADFIINLLFKKKKILPKNAIISGLIVGGVLDYTLAWYWVVLFSFAAIISKHLIKFHERHVFNPANFGLFWATVFGFPLTWSIETNIYLISIIGAYWIYKLKKIFHVLGFLTFFLVLFSTQGFNPLTLVSWFFVFVMLIEPQTSGVGRLRGFIFGAISGISAFIIFKIFPLVDFFVVSLVIANLSNIFLGKLIDSNKRNKEH